MNRLLDGIMLAVCIGAAFILVGFINKIIFKHVAMDTFRTAMQTGLGLMFALGVVRDIHGEEALTLVKINIPDTCRHPSIIEPRMTDERNPNCYTPYCLKCGVRIVERRRYNPLTNS